MKIRQTATLQDLDRKTTRTAAPKRSTAKSFTAALAQKEHEYSDYRAEIDHLRDEINEVGDDLEQEPTLENFFRFRGLLSQIAKKISDEAYRLNKIGGTPQNPRYFEIITVINAEADQLYAMLVKEQRDRMSITAKVIGIKGLVVNLIT